MRGMVQKWILQIETLHTHPGISPDRRTHSIVVTMVRVKNTAKIMHKHAKLLSKAKKAVMNAKKGHLIARDSSGLMHTGKLNVPFKKASSKAKKELVKQLKRR
jgi:hypothetical protein